MENQNQILATFIRTLLIGKPEPARNLIAPALREGPKWGVGSFLNSATSFNELDKTFLKNTIHNFNKINYFGHYSQPRPFLLKTPGTGVTRPATAGGLPSPSVDWVGGPQRQLSRDGLKESIPYLNKKQLILNPLYSFILASPLQAGKESLLQEPFKKDQKVFGKTKKGWIFVPTNLQNDGLSRGATPLTRFGLQVPDKIIYPGQIIKENINLGLEAKSRLQSQSSPWNSGVIGGLPSPTSVGRRRGWPSGASQSKLGLGRGSIPFRDGLREVTLPPGAVRTKMKSSVSIPIFVECISVFQVFSFDKITQYPFVDKKGLKQPNQTNKTCYFKPQLFVNNHKSRYFLPVQTKKIKSSKPSIGYLLQPVQEIYLMQTPLAKRGYHGDLKQYASNQITTLLSTSLEKKARLQSQSPPWNSGIIGGLPSPTEVGLGRGATLGGPVRHKKG